MKSFYQKSFGCTLGICKTEAKSCKDKQWLILRQTVLVSTFRSSCFCSSDWDHMGQFCLANCKSALGEDGFGASFGCLFSWLDGKGFCCWFFVQLSLVDVFDILLCLIGWNLKEKISVQTLILKFAGLCWLVLTDFVAILGKFVWLHSVKIAFLTKQE